MTKKIGKEPNNSTKRNSNYKKIEHKMLIKIKVYSNLDQNRR